MTLPPTRWELAGPANRGYGETFAQRVAEGADVDGEARLLDAMAPRRARILDIGSGMGRVAAALQARGHHVVATEPDPALRIRRIHWNAVASEPYREAIAADRLTELLPSTMLALSARLYTELQIAQRYQPVFNLPITNVPGPQVPLYLQGARLVQQYNTAPLFDSMGLVIVAVSYEGKLTLNFSTCPDVVADADALAGYVLDSLHAIEAATLTLEPNAGLDDQAATSGQTLADDAMAVLEGVLKKVLRRLRA